ncbi:MAG: site-specific tyrosine recombinase XerD [Microthrixaceae bacterium]
MGAGDEGLPAAAESFLLWLTVERGRSANTLAAYRRDLGGYVDWLGSRGLNVSTVGHDDVLSWVVELRDGLAVSSVARKVSVVRALHRWMASEGLSEVDPTLRLESPRQRDPIPKALSETDIERLLGAATASENLRDIALLEVLYGSGLRISEAVGLNLTDVDLEAKLMRVFGKGAKERIVPIGRVAQHALARYLDDGRAAMVPRRPRSRDDADAVFLNQRGGRLTRQGGWLILDRHARSVGLSVSPHVLRHSCATHMLDHGADIRAVQELLGHASISTTQRYTKVMTDRMWRVYEQAHPRAGSVS